MFKQFVLRSTLVMFGALAFLGLINCGGGGSDPKVTSPPTPVTYTTTLNPVISGITASPPSATGSTGDTKVSSVTLPVGYSNPTATPAGVGTFSNGLTVGTYTFTFVISSSNMTINISATKDPPPATYSISGKVTGASGVTVTLSTGESTLTDLNGNYTFPCKVSGNYNANATKNGYLGSPSNMNIGVNNADSVGNDFVMSFASPTVEMGIFVQDHILDGSPDNSVVAFSLTPMTKGTVYSQWDKKPGDSTFTFRGQYTASENGNYLISYLHQGLEFFDTKPDGTKVPWPYGVGAFRIVATPLVGIPTSTTIEVGILMGPNLLFGPLQQPPTITVDASGKRFAHIIGSWQTTPVLMIQNKYNTTSTIVATPEEGQNYMAEIPAEVYGQHLIFMALTDYPNARVTSTFVPEIPAPQ